MLKRLLIMNKILNIMRKTVRNDVFEKKNPRGITVSKR